MSSPPAAPVKREGESDDDFIVRVNEYNRLEAERLNAPNPARQQRESLEGQRARTTAASLSRARAAFVAGDMLSAPKVSDLEIMTTEPSSANVATMEQINDISAMWTALGVPDASKARVCYDLVLYCKDNGSSAQTPMTGTCSAAGSVSREKLAAAVKEVCLLRRFCAFYAKIIWNYMLVHDEPPANWAHWGYKHEQRFAAFDFFHGVTSLAALQPNGGLIREPSHDEIVAAQTNKQLKIFRNASKQDKSASTASEVTGGRCGPRARLMIKGSGSSE